MHKVTGRLVEWEASVLQGLTSSQEDGEAKAVGFNSIQKGQLSDTGYLASRTT